MTNEEIVPPFEQEVAALLARTMGDQDLWLVMSSETPSVADAEYLADTAARLFRATESPLSARLDTESPSEIDYAIGILREVADGSAMLSCRPPTRQRAALEVMARSQLAESIREHGVDAWAQSRGFVLPLEHLGPSRGDSGNGVNESGLTLRMFVAHFSAVASAYRQVEALHQARDGAELLWRDDFRRAAAEEVTEARAWLAWMRDRAPRAAHAVGLARRLMAEGAFVASREETPGVQLFPTRAYLQDLLRGSGGYAWLAEQAALVPEWLAEDPD